MASNTKTKTRRPAASDKASKSRDDGRTAELDDDLDDDDDDDRPPRGPAADIEWRREARRQERQNTKLANQLRTEQNEREEETGRYRSALIEAAVAVAAAQTADPEAVTALLARNGSLDDLELDDDYRVDPAEAAALVAEVIKARPQWAGTTVAAGDDTDTDTDAGDKNAGDDDDTTPPARGGFGPSDQGQRGKPADGSDEMERLGALSMDDFAAEKAKK